MRYSCLNECKILTRSTACRRDVWFCGISSESSDRSWRNIGKDNIKGWYVFLIGIAIYGHGCCSSAFWIWSVVRCLQLFAEWIGWWGWRGILMSSLAKYCAPCLHSVEWLGGLAVVVGDRDRFDAVTQLSPFPFQPPQSKCTRTRSASRTHVLP